MSSAKDLPIIYSKKFRLLCIFSLVILITIISLSNYFFSLWLSYRLSIKSADSPESYPVYLLTDGRLGNIMFEYATMVGICITKNFTGDITLCVRVCSSVKNEMSNKNFFDTFPSLQRSADNCTNYQNLIENEDSKAIGKILQDNIYFEEKISFDSKVFKHSKKSYYSGYFQSYKYHLPYGVEHIKNLFQFSKSIDNESKSVMKTIKTSPLYNNNYPLVCLACRLGDKVKGKLAKFRFYDGWSLSTHYYYAAYEHFQDLYGRINLVIFTGGSNNKSTFSDKESDIAWTKRYLVKQFNASKRNQIFNIEDFDKDNKIDFYNNPTISMKVLSLCDNIIISSSSFGWWAAYLANHSNVVAPKYIYNKKIEKEQNYKPEDYYPPQWKLLTDREKDKDYIKLNKIKYSFNILNNNRGNDLTTVVTAYYKVPSKKHYKIYLKWIDIFMSMGFRVVIFVDKDSYSLLYKQWPETERRKYITRPLQSFYTSKWNWTIDELIDPERTFGHNELLYKIWNEKIFMVRDIAVSNPFSTEYFAWVDIGCFRTSYLLDYFKGFPNPDKIHRNKVNFLQILPFTENEKQNIYPVDNRFLYLNRIGGGHFMGNKDSLVAFTNIYHDLIDEMKSYNLFTGKDQSLFAFSLLRHPYLVASFKAVSSNYDRWFIVQHLWSNAGKPIKNSHVPIKPMKPLVLPNKCPCKVCLFLLSTAKDVQLRDAIREGWLSQLFHHSLRNKDSFDCQLFFDYKFVVGRDKEMEAIYGNNGINGTEKILRHEMNYYDDLWVLPFIDDYWNLTVKTSLIFKLAPQRFQDCHYFFKVDADVYIHAREFYSLVSTELKNALLRNNMVYGGYYYDQNSKGRVSHVSRNPSNKHSMTITEFSNSSFDPYAGGPLYFMSRAVAEALPYTVNSVNNELIPSTFVGQNPPRGLYKLEDAYLGHLIYYIHPKVLSLFIDNIFPLGEYSGLKKNSLNKKKVVSYHGVKDIELMRNGFNNKC